MPDSLLCDLCEHLNPLDAPECSRCGADLHRQCARCKEVIPAYRHVCPHCQHHLWRGSLSKWGGWLWGRLTKSMFGRVPRLSAPGRSAPRTESRSPAEA